MVHSGPDLHNPKQTSWAKWFPTRWFSKNSSRASIKPVTTSYVVQLYFQQEIWVSLVLFVAEQLPVSLGSVCQSLFSFRSAASWPFSLLRGKLTHLKIASRAGEQQVLENLKIAVSRGLFSALLEGGESW